MSAIQELRKLVEHPFDGRVKLLVETARAALDEIDKNYVRKYDPPTPTTPRIDPRRIA